MLLKTLILAALTCAAGNAFAATSAKEPFPLDATSTAEFRTQADTLRKEMQSGRYASLSSKDKTRVDKQLEKLDALYVKRTGGAKVEDADAVDLVNASSEINSILAGKDDERLICEQVKTIGSNRTQKVCMTAAQRSDLHKDSQRDMRDRKLNGRSNN